MFDMMGKIAEAKKKVEEARQKLGDISVAGESGNGRVKIIADANRRVKDVTIQGELSEFDKDELEDLLAVAINKAIENANAVQEEELTAAAKEVMPNMPGMGGLGNLFK
jgi:DNA-binding YbaB/EbfC family protein